VNPDGMEVIVPVTAAMLPLELGLPVAVELGVPVSLSVGELLSLSVGDLVLVPIGPPPVELVPGRDCGDVDAPLGMMTPTLVDNCCVGGCRIWVTCSAVARSVHSCCDSDCRNWVTCSATARFVHSCCDGDCCTWITGAIAPIRKCQVLIY
jgi:hypothetical protein